eukprot:3941941-Rhodomonas_salina.1
MRGTEVAYGGSRGRSRATEALWPPAHVTSPTPLRLSDAHSVLTGRTPAVPCLRSALCCARPYCDSVCSYQRAWYWRMLLAHGVRTERAYSASTERAYGGSTDLAHGVGTELASGASTEVLYGDSGC